LALATLERNVLQGFHPEARDPAAALKATNGPMGTRGAWQPRINLSVIATR